MTGFPRPRARVGIRIDPLVRAAFSQYPKVYSTATHAKVARMWRFTRNNGTTEDFQRKMKLIQRRAYGY